MATSFTNAKQLRDWLNLWDDDTLIETPVISGELRQLRARVIDGIDPNSFVLELTRCPENYITEQQQTTAIRLGDGDFFRGIRAALASRTIE